MGEAEREVLIPTMGEKEGRAGKSWPGASTYSSSDKEKQASNSVPVPYGHLNLVSFSRLLALPGRTNGW